jgi:hypothetical protein
MDNRPAARLGFDSRPIRLGALCAVLCCALAVTACGSSITPHSAARGASSPLVRYAACMRSHGVPDFPDPSTTQGPNSFGIDGYNFNLPASVDSRSPAYTSANQGCFKLVGGGGGPAGNPAFLAKAKQRALAHAVCMRQHGVPNFPDPTFSSNGQGITVGSGGGGINPRSPAFQQAQRVCQGR